VGKSPPGGVGRSDRKIDAHPKVTGKARYPDDLAPADALWARVVFTGKPHARLLSLDFSAAEATPGVIAVFGSADVPVNEYGLTLFDQPVFVGLENTGRSVVRCNVSRWEADHLALVVAETRAAADTGAAAIVAEWEDLPLVSDIDAALAKGAAPLHPELTPDSNIYQTDKFRRGDMDAGWAEADVIVEGVYEVPHQEHAYLQPEAALSYVDDEGRPTVEVAGQWTHEDRKQIAHALDLPDDSIRVIYPAIGGAFGGREDTSLQIVMALAAQQLAERGETRPIRARWSREESIIGHHKRHRGRIRTRWGAKADGTIVAVEAKSHLDAGAYNYTTNKVLGNLHLCVPGPYVVANLHVDSHAVYTTSVPGGAFRGFGAPQGAFVAECQINKLAEALGMDPVEIRRRNMIRDGSVGHTGSVYPSGVSLPAVVERCAAESAWGDPGYEPPGVDPEPFASLPAEPDDIRRGRGFACAYKNVGYSFGFPERCESRIVLHGEPGDTEPTRADLFHAGADVGQGGHTVFRQMAAEATGLPADAIRAHYSDTATAGDSGSASASRLTWMSGNSILGAAEEAAKAWLDGDRPAEGFFRYVPPPTEALDPDTGECDPNFAYGYVAQSVDVSVDIGTGHVTVHRVVSVNDVGRAINPDLVVGQIEGAVVQAHGYAVTEDLQLRDGHITNPRLSGYLMPGIGEIPERVDSVVMEVPDPIGPFGARGMAEMPYLPYAPAVVSALHDATGVWFDAFPLTPSRVLAGLRAAGITPSSVPPVAAR
jgi:CO/xanthine dehydrogenase Mo-binding subunit